MASLKRTFNRLGMGNWELGMGEAVRSSPLALASPFGRRGDAKSDGVSPSGATAVIEHGLISFPPLSSVFSASGVVPCGFAFGVLEE
jgi:hypothetical protein